MTRLKDKVVLVTGGSAGIGEAIARRCAREGAAVVITGRRKEELERVAGEIANAGGRAVTAVGDVGEESHVRAAVGQAVKSFGKLTTLVNNAGVGAFGKGLHELDDQTWDQLITTNLTGVFRMTRAAIPEMLKRGGGAIINISSIAGLIGIPMTSAYSATKGGLDALTRCIAVDYARSGIRCNAVCPGLVDTPMAADLLADAARSAQVLEWYPINRAGTPDEVASLVIYLASDEATWVTGGIFPIDGGRTAQ